MMGILRSIYLTRLHRVGHPAAAKLQLPTSFFKGNNGNGGATTVDPWVPLLPLRSCLPVSEGLQS